jgi:hypothetical protein
VKVFVKERVRGITEVLLRDWINYDVVRMRMRMVRMLDNIVDRCTCPEVARAYGEGG